MIVADTNVILRGVRSPRGASGYVLKRQGALGEPPVASREEIEIVLDALCLRAVETSPWFRFRPFLDDPKDDLFVECALAAEARTIVTDDSHFRHPSVAAFGIRAISAGDFVSALLRGRNSQ